MRILFLSGYYPPNTRGGGELSTHFIAQGLKQAGHEVEVVTEGKRPETREWDGIKVYLLPLRLTAKPLLEKRSSRRNAKEFQAWLKTQPKYDIIHAHDFRTALMLSELGLPNALVTARDYAQICGSPNNLLADGTVCPGCTSIGNVLKNRAVAEAPLWRKPFRIWQYRFNIKYRLAAFRKFPRQIFISNAQLAEIKKIQDLSQAKTHVIYNPVPASYLAEPATKKTTGQDVLYVGTVDSYKGVDVLLDAFKALSQRHSDVHLKIVGEGAALARYKQWVELSGLQYRVTFTGRVNFDRLRSMYDEAALVVAPHVWVEPFGRTTVEAMARGKIVVASDIGGPAEIIRDGQTGILFRAGQATDLARALGQVLDMGELDKRVISHNARQWIRENLSLDIIAGQYSSIYRAQLSLLQ